MYRQDTQLIELLEPVAVGLGYEMLGIQLNRQQGSLVLRLYIDSSDGITVDDCARVSEQMIGVLDVHDPIKEQYHLEVSSPGLDRPLFTLLHFEQFLGRQVKIKLNKKINERRTIIGNIKAVKDACVLIDEDGAEHSISADTIKSACLVYEPAR